MDIVSFNARVFARAMTPEAVEEMRHWTVGDIFACSERQLETLVEELGLRHVRNAFIDSQKEQLGSPHFFADMESVGPVGLYFVCVSHPAAYASLTKREYDWCGRHPERAVLLMPCIVQRMAGDYARCVAEQLIPLRVGGVWGKSDDARQFFPVEFLPSRPFMSVFGTAFNIKYKNVLREIANAGHSLFPYIKGAAKKQRMPASYILKGSAEEPPLMLALGEKMGARSMRLLYGDFYSWHNPCNELEVYGFAHGKGGKEVMLIDRQGAIYCAFMAETFIFPKAIRIGMHFKWAVSLLADELILLHDDGLWSDGGNEKNERVSSIQKKESFFTGTEACSSVQDKALFMQEEGSNHAKLFSRVEKAFPVEFCGVAGYCMQVRPNAAPADLVFNIYAFAPALGKREPKAGDIIWCYGALYAAPDSIAESAECWADSPEADGRRNGQELASVENLLKMRPYSLAFAIVIEALTKGGYFLDKPYEPLFRRGMSDFLMRDRAGNRLSVMVDSVVDGHVDKEGYSRLAKGDDSFGGRLYLTVRLNSVSGLPGSYHVSVDFPEEMPQLEFRSFISMADAFASEESQMIILEKEETALGLFMEMMNERKFSAIISCLREDLHYISETTPIELYSKLDFLRHFQARFDEWEEHGIGASLEFYAGTIEIESKRRPCIIAAFQKKVFSATIASVTDGLVHEIKTLSGKALFSLRLINKAGSL